MRRTPTPPIQKFAREKADTPPNGSSPVFSALTILQKGSGVLQRHSAFDPNPAKARLDRLTPEKAKFYQNRAKRVFRYCQRVNTLVEAGLPISKAIRKALQHAPKNLRLAPKSLYRYHAEYRAGRISTWADCLPRYSRPQPRTGNFRPLARKVIVRAKAARSLHEVYRTCPDAGRLSVHTLRRRLSPTQRKDLARIFTLNRRIAAAKKERDQLAARLLKGAPL
jgi:hypothetical protein